MDPLRSVLRPGRLPELEAEKKSLVKYETEEEVGVIYVMAKSVIMGNLAAVWDRLMAEFYSDYSSINNKVFFFNLYLTIQLYTFRQNIRSCYITFFFVRTVNIHTLVNTWSLFI